MLALHIIFWASILALVHTYLAYPLLVRLLASKKHDNDDVYSRNDVTPPGHDAGSQGDDAGPRGHHTGLPGVTVIVPAHNEEVVIREKLLGVLRSDYPMNLVDILVGSDASTDSTNSIVQEVIRENSNVRLVTFARSGKPSVVNALVAQAKHDIVVLTDANVLLGDQTLFELVKHFKNPSIALVESNMQHTTARQEGIGLQESAYLGADAEIKRAEGLVWGSMMGPTGGCFAVRRSFYTPVPANFLVDDFYINMKVLEQGGKSVYASDAHVYEDVSNVLREEFRRKVRIATGSYQNLFAFLPLLFRFNAVSFIFFSHKVLRWIGPLFLIAASLASVTLAALLELGPAKGAYTAVSIGFATLFLLPAVDWIAKRLHLHLFGIRLLSYFCGANAALLCGMYRFVRGVKSGTWTPTERNQ